MEDCTESQAIIPATAEVCYVYILEGKKNPNNIKIIMSQALILPIRQHLCWFVLVFFNTFEEISRESEQTNTKVLW